ncbi:LysR substrate-binding domain-containing protein [Spongiibacter marinus]|uniref:LysR substrate-binding domain-containing protein n=1 Tax=Spongiibacter marinus TaxID=354246 RepID=UPI003C40F3FD
MDKFHLLKVYVAVAEAEGFAAAARRLELSPPAVTRAIAALEDNLGVKLLQRSTRYVRTTDIGRRYLDDAKRILAELEAADHTASGINTEPQGQLTVTAPVLFGRRFITPSIVRYLERYPKTTVNAVFLDRVVNLLEEGIDVGIRIGELPDSSLRGRNVGSVRMVVCASPDYLQRCGRPERPEDLRKHCLIASLAVGENQHWHFQAPYKARAQQRITIAPRLTVTTNDAAVEAAVNGLGITRVLSYQVADEVAAGKLEILLEDYQPAAKPITILHREDRNPAVKVRAFIDMLAEEITGHSALH